jgi:RNA polymerase sigma factor (sigma-70 family)
MEEQDDLYLQAVSDFGKPLARLARAYESDPEQQRDLLQDIHFALWRSLATFNGQCSLRTWSYRVAHNVAISTTLRRRTRHARLVSLEELAQSPNAEDVELSSSEQQQVTRLQTLIRRLKPPDDQVMLLYLEDLDAASISEITGLSPGAVATRIHRAKALLARQFRG